jgi:type III pantothenate kinase
MKLFIDAGNTRIKWAMRDAAGWCAVDSLPTARAHELSFPTDPISPQVWVSNVAGETVAQAIRAACAAHGWQTHFVRAEAAQCGVKNGYANPHQLGCDRWAALIGAWRLQQKACLVVNCGTATTVDALSARGEFLGGLILSGISLMQSSLTGATAQLQHATGSFHTFPTNTVDALFCGAIQATCGAIERQFALLNEADASVILSGGAAHTLLPALHLPTQLVDNVVLQGLWQISQEMDG